MCVPCTQAVWYLKARALTLKNWIDDTELEEEVSERNAARGKGALTNLVRVSRDTSRATLRASAADGGCSDGGQGVPGLMSTE